MELPEVVERVSSVFKNAVVGPQLLIHQGILIYLHILELTSLLEAISSCNTCGHFGLQNSLLQISLLHFEINFNVFDLPVTNLNLLQISFVFQSYWFCSLFGVYVENLSIFWNIQMKMHHVKTSLHMTKKEQVRFIMWCLINTLTVNCMHCFPSRF